MGTDSKHFISHMNGLGITDRVQRQTVEQNRPESLHEWTLWRYWWKPTQPGKYWLLARASSERQQQPIDDKNGKDGSSGILRIQATLEA